MKNILISCLLLLLAAALGAMDPASAHVFGYKSTASYPEVIERLRTDPHPWAAKFLHYMEATERQNRTDLQKLLNANNAISLPCSEEQFKEKLSQKLLTDEEGSANLLATLKAEHFKINDHWVLFTSLTKMIGIDGQPGILRDSGTFINDHAWVCDGKGDQIIALYGNQVTVAKNSLSYALLAKEGDPNIVKGLDIIHPTVVPPNEMVIKHAKKLTLYCEDTGKYYQPSASYAFGANPTEINKNIWDCSSFIALVIGSDFRFSTQYFEEAIKVKRGEMEATEETESIMRQMDIVPLDLLEFMDIVVWRGHTGGGHMAFYLGEGQGGKIVIGDSNRSDDKSIEGTGILETTLYKDKKYTYAFRRKDPRKN